MKNFFKLPYVKLSERFCRLKREYNKTLQKNKENLCRELTIDNYVALCATKKMKRAKNGKF